LRALGGAIQPNTRAGPSAMPSPGYAPSGSDTGLLGARRGHILPHTSSSPHSQTRSGREQWIRREQAAGHLFDANFRRCLFQRETQCRQHPFAVAGTDVRRRNGGIEAREVAHKRRPSVEARATNYRRPPTQTNCRNQNIMRSRLRRTQTFCGLTSASIISLRNISCVT
jgi:hypothetical protein